MEDRVPPRRGRLSERELLDEVFNFVADELNVKRAGMRLDDAVNRTYCVDGDDGVELMIAFSERFGVDLADYPHDRHFGPEGLSPVELIRILLDLVLLLPRLVLDALRGTTRPSRSSFTETLDDLHMRDLVASARAGTWSYDHERREAAP